MTRINLTGKKFSRLTVTEYSHTDGGRAYWKCKCDCGNEATVSAGNLKSGLVRSCGCLKSVPHNKTHGESQTRLYRHWISMVRRCTKPNTEAYKWYGARGIKVCREWMTFEGFKAWVMNTRPDESYTVERIDVNGDYSPENCKWIPMSEQANNRTTCVIIEHNGETKNLTEWCAELNLSYKLVHNRITKLHWSFEKAISTPIDVKRRNKKHER